MAFDAQQFLRDQHIPFDVGGKNVTPGWTSVRCPFCGDHSNHGGFSPEGHYNCWRCGGHSAGNVVQALLQVPLAAALQVVDTYTTRAVAYTLGPRLRANARSLQLPFKVHPLGSEGRDYLLGRGYDPDALGTKYGLGQTGPAGLYACRIYIPIIYNGQVVSFQCRDWTGRSALRYRSCPHAAEVVHHKSILYNLDNCCERWVIVVEGVADVWRVGANCCATFGTTVLPQQVAILAERFDKVWVMFDAETPAQGRAKALVNMIQTLGRAASRIKLDAGDPGEAAPAVITNILTVITTS